MTAKKTVLKKEVKPVQKHDAAALKIVNKTREWLRCVDEGIASGLVLTNVDDCGCLSIELKNDKTEVTTTYWVEL